MTNPLAIDPEVFRPDAIDPETAAFNEQRPAGPVFGPEVTAHRAGVNALAAAGPRSALAQERTLPGPQGALPVRVFVPDSVRGVYLDIHGGGWCAGSPAMDDLLNERIAQTCQLAVVSVDYRLAPEFPYPAGPDDCEAAAVWLVEHAQAEFGTDRLLIGGMSAGGHLAAVTLLRLRDRHGYTGFLGANLRYGSYDLTMTPSAARGDGRFGPSGPFYELCRSRFVPDPSRWRDPDVSPLYADLHDLPPALFTVGTLDPLLDDSLFMAARWVAAGNQAELAVYSGGAHGVDRSPLKLAEQARARMLTFLQARVAEPVSV